MNCKVVLLWAVSLCMLMPVWAQDDLMDLLDEKSDDEQIEYDNTTFKATRIVNGRSVKMLAGGEMMFVIEHRFGRLDGGIREFFGLDNANIRFGLEYGITDWLGVGFGRSSFNKVWDGFVKVAAMRQSSGRINFPLSIVWYSNAGINSSESIPGEEIDGKHRFSFAHQLMIARKFNRVFSFQITPSITHYNLIDDDSTQANTSFAMGFGGRAMITRSMSINAEYYMLTGKNSDIFNDGQFANSLSLSVDIETGGHVFQIMVTNSRGMVEQQFITRTRENWWDGAVHIGFNIHRTFSIVDYNKRQQKKEKKQLKKEQAG